jgi:hypothetical protein
MRPGRLVLALATTGYVLIAIQPEEQDLVGLFGDPYRDYQAGWDDFPLDSGLQGLTPASRRPSFPLPESPATAKAGDGQLGDQAA